MITICGSGQMKSRPEVNVEMIQRFIDSPTMESLEPLMVNCTGYDPCSKCYYSPEHYYPDGEHVLFCASSVWVARPTTWEAKMERSGWNLAQVLLYFIRVLAKYQAEEGGK